MTNIYSFGQCTWWAANMALWCLRYGNLDNARYWAANWASHGGTVVPAPVVGSIACFQPGVDGAGSVGHVAYVVAVASGAQTFSVTEMDFPTAGVVDTRTTYAGAGVSFLLAGGLEMLMIQNASTGSVSLISGGKAVHVDSPATAAALKAAGIQYVVIDAAEFNAMVATFS